MKHSVHLKNLSGSEIRHLKRLIEGDSRLSRSKIAKDLNASLPERVTTSTIRSYLKDLAFEYVVKISG